MPIPGNSSNCIKSPVFRGYSRWKQFLANCVERCRPLGRNSFVRLNGLDILIAEGACVKTKFLQHSGDLLWLRWYNCPYKSIPSGLSMENMRVLELFNGDFETLWGDDQAPAQLRELNILGNLERFPRSIGMLQNLEKIVLKESSNMRTLPEHFCSLKSLKRLELRECRELRSLPERFGDLTNLQHLDLFSCVNLRTLPDSFNRLVQLRYLSLIHCSSLNIPPEILEEISTLEYLDLTRCENLEVFSPQKLSYLKELRVDGCWKLRSIRGLDKLVRLNKIQIAAGTVAIWKDIQCLQRRLTPCSMILSARATGDDENGMESILHSLGSPHITLVNYSQDLGFQVPKFNVESCGGLIMCFICKASTKYEFGVHMQAQWNTGHACARLLYSVSPAIDGEFIVMSIFTKDSGLIHQLKFCEYVKVLVECDVKKGWMLVERHQEELNIFQVWYDLFTYARAKQLSYYGQSCQY